MLLPWRSDDDDNGKGGGEEGDIDLWHKDNNQGTTCVTTPAEGRVVVHGGLKKKNGKTVRLTAEALRSLNPAGLSECGGRRPAASHSSGETLDNSSQHSSHSSSHNAVGIRTRRNGRGDVGKRPSPGVRLSSGVDVVAEWDRHLARVKHDDDAEDGRGHATITLGGDDIVSVAEDHVTGPRRSFAQAPCSLSRAARFAIGGRGGGGGGHNTIGRGGKGAGLKGDDGQPLMYGMRYIIASGRRASKGIKGGGAGLWREEEDEEEDEAIPTLLDSGWKNGGGSRRKSRRATRTRKNAGYGDGGGHKLSCGATSREEGKLRRVSPDNSALRAKLFALAKGERRESLLFKRAFLNAEGGSVSLRQ
ncbi:unnamed protein product [Ectocarpus sp. 8 AP-2014]